MLAEPPDREGAFGANAAAYGRARDGEAERRGRGDSDRGFAGAGAAAADGEGAWRSAGDSDRGAADGISSGSSSAARRSGVSDAGAWFPAGSVRGPGCAPPGGCVGPK